MGKSNIEWTDMVWNPVTGCTKISPGCQNCYAERMAMRFTGHFNVTCHPDRLDQPLHWKKPRRIFVCSMGDLFHEDVPDEFITAVWMRMLTATNHTFLVLTKRPERMREMVSKMFKNLYTDEPATANCNRIWLGVTAENQEQADKRIPILLQIPAAKRFVSIEPMLGAVNLWHIPEAPGNPDDPPEPYIAGLNWVIVGAESGAGRRTCDTQWIREIVRQCKTANVPVFVKQIHQLYKKSRHNYGTTLSKNMAEWPEDLRVREYPG